MLLLCCFCVASVPPRGCAAGVLLLCCCCAAVQLRCCHALNGPAALLSSYMEEVRRLSGLEPKLRAAEKELAAARRARASMAVMQEQVG